MHIFWFRRDLRLADNAGLYAALKAGSPVLPIFIFDTDILSRLSNAADRRVHFIMLALQDLQRQLESLGSTLHVITGKPLECIAGLTETFPVNAVYTNHDYEPYARRRDAEVSQMLQQRGIAFHNFKDQVIFEKDEVLKDDGTPYTVYTPYSKKWKLRLNEFYLKPYPNALYYENFYRTEPLPLPTLADIGFQPTDLQAPPNELNTQIAANYEHTRDIPAIIGTTRLSVHLRFGTVSIRNVANQAHALNEKLLQELIWRDFYMALLWHYPHVEHRAFKPEYDGIQWSNNEAHFQRWCNGQTGIPIVDAGMRELNATGYMHNRVRMITASFLVKNLLIDWRWGEAYFAEKLLDFDLAANNGGWQWAAGCGCDAAPYFRVFNPLLQTQKFDPQLTYIRKWIPELDTFHYPQPIVDLAASRERCLTEYKRALSEARS